MVSSSCSTTMRLLPRSRRFFSVASSLSLSRWCSPMDGSSKIYSTPIRLLPIWVASRIRWLSPPERVPALRARVRYPRPTDFKKPSRDRISFRMRSAISICCSVSVRPSIHARASSTERVVNS